MAKIGLRGIRYGVRNEDGTYQQANKVQKSFGVARRPGKSITADVTINTNDVKQYGDDAVTETDKSFKDGTLSLEVSDLSQNDQSIMLGHKMDEDGVMTANANDQAPYMGVGFIGTKKVHGVICFRALMLLKVQFGEPNDKNKTKGETTSFDGEEITGSIMADENLDWKKEKTFSSYEEADEFLDGFFEEDETTDDGSQGTGTDTTD